MRLIIGLLLIIIICCWAMDSVAERVLFEPQRQEDANCQLENY